VRSETNFTFHIPKIHRIESEIHLNFPEIRSIRLGPNFFPKRILKYFLYRAAAAATGQPPSLSLLPACHIPMYGRECDVNDPFQQKRVFDEMDTGSPASCAAEAGTAAMRS
jgi:hypothetical protein